MSQEEIIDFEIRIRKVNHGFTVSGSARGKESSLNIADLSELESAISTLKATFNHPEEN